MTEEKLLIKLDERTLGWLVGEAEDRGTSPSDIAANIIKEYVDGERYSPTIREVIKNVEKVKRAVDKLENEYGEFTSKLLEVALYIDNRLERIENEKVTLEEVNSNLKEEITTLKEENRRLEMENGKLKDEISRLEEIIRELETKVRREALKYVVASTLRTLTNRKLLMVVVGLFSLHLLSQIDVVHILSGAFRWFVEWFKETIHYDNSILRIIVDSFRETYGS